jgi:predicted RecA/RadA family phage recombinase
MRHSFDLHLHTHYSADACGSPEAMVAAAKHKGLSGIALADHNTCDAVEYLTRKGLIRPSMTDYAPAVARSAGDVIPVSDNVRIVHTDIAANALGAFSAGGAIYDVDKPSGANTNLSAGRNINWDDSVSGAVSKSTTYYLGQVVADAGVSDVKARVLHLPRPS